MPTKPNGAVVVGGHVNGLGLVRSLAANGRRVALVSTHPFDIAHRSRWVEETRRIESPDKAPDAVAELLERQAGRWCGRVVIPANDEAVAGLSAHRERLARWYRVAAPPREVAEIFLDKDQLLRVARAVGVAVPRDYGPVDEATAARSDLTYPVLAKPTSGHRFLSRFGAKLFVANGQEELMTAVRRFAEARLEGRVFDRVPGADDQIYAHCTYLDRDGNPTDGITVRKLRQNPPGYGIARVAELALQHGALQEPTVEILRHIGYRGIAVAEFKLDPRDGCYRLLEINGRSVVYNTLLRRGGMDLAELIWSDCVTGHPGRVEVTRWGGVWVHLHADLLHSALSHRREEWTLRQYLEPYGRPKEYAVWSRRDPGPFLVEWSRTFREAAKAASGGTWRERLRDRTRPHP